jgi:hypothetical protein
LYLLPRDNYPPKSMNRKELHNIFQNKDLALSSEGGVPSRGLGPGTLIPVSHFRL